jgi:hypothetical protein
MSSYYAEGCVEGWMRDKRLMYFSHAGREAGGLERRWREGGGGCQEGGAEVRSPAVHRGPVQEVFECTFRVTPTLESATCGLYVQSCTDCKPLGGQVVTAPTVANLAIHKANMQDQGPYE